jgi:nucleoid DNA-binding protein
MANLTKRDLVLSISEKSTLTQQEIFTVIQLTLDGIIRLLKNRVQIALEDILRSYPQ